MTRYGAVTGELESGSPREAVSDRRRLRAALLVLLLAAAGAASALGQSIGETLVHGARTSVERGPVYDTGYYQLEFPGGDPGWERGTSSDLIVRAFRYAGIDLQVLVVEDIAAHPEVYRLRSADPNIDHRRIKNLVFLLQRRGLSLPVTSDDWQAGDIVVWGRKDSQRASHIGIVTDRESAAGEPFVVYHTSHATGRPAEGAVLNRWPIIGHFRWQRKERIRSAPPRLATSSPSSAPSASPSVARPEAQAAPEPRLESQPETPVDIPPIIVEVPAVAEPTPPEPEAPAPPPAARARSGFTSDGYLGRSVAIGDFNGDGYADVAVGAPGKRDGDVDQLGLVLLFKGSESGLSAWHEIGQTKLGDGQSASQFGWSLAAGDFNGDGMDDLAVGAPGEAPWADRPSGWVFLFRGSEDRVAAWGGLGQGALGKNEAGDRFGFSLVAADLNDDGVDDLAVGAPGESVTGAEGSGWVFAYRGSDGGLQDWHAFGQGELGSDEADDRFGWSLASEDFDGDGVSDLAVGAPGEVPGYKDQSGWVYVFRGGEQELEGWQSLGQIGLGRDETGDEFGAALAADDFNDDGVGDLVVGAPGEAFGREAQSGWVFVYFGSSYGMRSWKSLGQDDLEENEPNDRFGSALVAGDFDGDGKSDLAVGVPGEAFDEMTGSGSVFLYRGAGTDLLPWRTVQQTGAGEGYDRFGLSIAVGDFDRDGKSDLAIGAPGAEDADASAPALGYLVNGATFVPDRLPDIDAEDGR